MAAWRVLACCVAITTVGALGEERRAPATMHSSVGKSVVVVGNGVSVIGSALGEQIDAFDEVARFNHFVIRGYEQDVGTKTTIMVMAQIKSPKDCPPDGRLQRAKRILVPFSYRHGKCVQPNVPCKVREKVQRDTLRKKIDALKRLYVSAKVGSKTVITTLEEVDLLYTKYKLYEKFPSSGLQVLMFMTKHFEKVYYTGFDFNARSHDHYFETKVKNMTCHNMADEARVIQALELEGKLVNLNPIAAAATVRLPRTQLFSSLRADYSPDCKIVCGAVHHLPADICQKWHVPPPGILPWQVSYRVPHTAKNTPKQVDGPLVANQGKTSEKFSPARARVAAASSIAPAPAPVQEPMLLMAEK